MAASVQQRSLLTLPLRARAAQLVMPRLGSNMPPPVSAERDAERALALVGRCPVGGFVLFNGSLDTTSEVLAALQARSPQPLLIGTDMERGVGQQIEGATVFPHARAFGALGDEAEALAEQSARAAAREALACGLHITFAPVADVNLNVQNPIIATRAFSEAPDEAARLAAAYVRGCRAEGLLTAAKHFPGHGRTAADSHEALPVLDAPRETLEAEEFAPFRAALAAGAELVMTAHVAAPALDPSGAPATLSRPILHSVLRRELGFGGAVITDSLLMGAIRETHDDAGRQAAALVKAGVDVLLDPPDPEAMVDGLVEAVRAGDLPEAQLDAAVRRVGALKAQMQRRHGEAAFAPGAAAREAVDWNAHRRLAENVARRAVTVLEAAPGALPLAPQAPEEGERLLVVRMTSREQQEDAEAPLGAAVRDVFPGAAYHEVGPAAGGEAMDGVRAAARRAQVLVLALAVEPAAWHRFGLRPAQERLAGALAEGAAPLIAAALGSPHVLEGVPRAAARLCTYSDVPAAQRALVDVLAGRAAPA